MPIDDPPRIHLWDHTHLGPDPEPLGERFDVLMRRERAGRPSPAPVPVMVTDRVVAGWYLALRVEAGAARGPALR